MRFKFFLSFLSYIFFIGSIFCVTNYQEIFLQANNEYKKSNFTKAYELYKSIPAAGPEINYNLGNCAYRLGQFGYALFYWRKAERDWGIFDRAELLENIYLIKNKLSDGNQKPKNKFFESLRKFKNYSISLVKSVPLFAIQILFLAIWFFLFLYVRFLFKRKRRFLIIILFVLSSLLGILLVIKYSLYFKHQGVVISKKAVLLSGPGKTFQELGGLLEASEVLIQKESGDFYKIKFNRQSGCISQKDIEKI